MRARGTTFRRTRRRLAAVLVAALFGSLAVTLVPTAATAAASPRIMVVGDSISQGQEGDYTWRYRLHQHLTSKGVTPTFVGPWTGTNHGTAYTGQSDAPVPHDGAYRPGISFPSANLAEWGWMMAEGKAAIAAQMKTYAPDYLLVELGFNDIAWNLGTSTPTEIANSVLGSMKEFVTNARAVNPNIRILLTDVPHRAPIDSYPELPGKLDAYDSRIGAAIDAVNAASSSPPVVRVGFDAAYRYSTDTYDGLHPNVRGEYVIAKAFADQLSARYGVGGTMTIPASLPANLTPGAVGTVTTKVNSDWSVNLTWSPVFGAGGYWIWVRDNTNGEADFHKLIFPIGSYGWKATQLAAGHKIDFQIQTMRGDYSAALSPIASITAPALGAVTFTATPGKYSATLKWTPVPGADDYHIYAGGSCADQIPSVTDNMQLVQWSLGDRTEFTQTYITGLCMNYYIVASKWGGEGPRPGFATRVWPLQDNWDYVGADQHYFQNTPAAGDKVWRGSVAPGTDRGILLMRGFIENKSALDQLIGDHRTFNSAPDQSAKATIVWNTRTGAVAIYMHKSCLFGDNGWQCKDALPIGFTGDAYSVSDTSTDYRNLFTLAKNADGGLTVGVSAVNAWTPTIKAGTTAECISTLLAIAPAGLAATDACSNLTNLGRISDRITVSPSGGSFSVKLVGDKYPSWEFVRYPADGTLGSFGIDKVVATRTQTNVTDLKGTPVTCTGPGGEGDPPGQRPMSCS